MPPPEPPVWLAVAIVALCGLNIAIGIFEVVSGRPSWLRRIRLSRRRRLPAAPRDRRLLGAVTSLASGGVMPLAIGQELMLGRVPSLRTSLAPMAVALAMGLVAVLLFAAAFVAFQRVEYLPPPGAGQRH